MWKTLIEVAFTVQLALGLGVLLWALFYVWDKVLTWFLGFIRVNNMLVRFSYDYYRKKRAKRGESADGVYRPKIKEDD